MLLLSGRETPMDDRDKEYLGFVSQCEGMAENETDPERKSLWRSLAEKWREKIRPQPTKKTE